MGIRVGWVGWVGEGGGGGVRVMMGSGRARTNEDTNGRETVSRQLRERRCSLVS